MLALAMQFSRCSEARTSRAEQCARPVFERDSSAFHFSLRRRQKAVPGTRRTSGELERAAVPSSQCIDLESSGLNGTIVRSPACQRLLRKEVIQPHLPVRLPCYDFTPIADPTFDSSLRGLGHWLRVLPTFVV